MRLEEKINEDKDIFCSRIGKNLVGKIATYGLAAILTLGGVLYSCGDGGNGEVGITETKTFNIISYNVQARPYLDVTIEKLETIGTLLNEYDMVGIQECFVNYDHLIKYNNHPTKYYFDDLYDDTLVIVNSGLASFSIFPLIEVKTIHYEYKYNIEDLVASKGMLMMRYDVDGMILDVYNTHMEAGGAPEDAEPRFNQATQVIEFVKENSPSNHNVIVHGDFNMSPARPNKAWEDFDPNHYRDTVDMESRTNIFQRIVDELGLTDVSDALFGAVHDHIDRFLFRSADGYTLIPLNLKEINEPFIDDEGNPLSDHNPMVATFELTGLVTGQ